jgi:hypothetical protein
VSSWLDDVRIRRGVPRPETPSQLHRNAYLIKYEKIAIPRQVRPGASFSDAKLQHREPAQQHVGADAWFDAVADGAEFEGGLEVTEASFNLEQVLVAERDILRGQVGVRGDRRYWPSNRSSEVTLDSRTSTARVMISNGSLIKVM